MIPAGYITLPEALDIIEQCIDDDDALLLGVSSDLPDEVRQRLAAIRTLAERICCEWKSVGPGERPSVVDPDPEIPLYVKSGGNLTQMAAETIEDLIDEAGTRWIGRGHPSLEYRRNPDEEYWPTTAAYNGCQFLVKEADIREHWSRPSRVERTGPGRPSSKSLVREEFERRRCEGLREDSRNAEAKALAEWLRRTHPDADPAAKRTIRKYLTEWWPQSQDDCAKQ